MPKDYQRADRVASTIQRCLSVLIRTEIKDPRVTGIITINQVTISKDLSSAKIYVSVLEQAAADTIVVAALNNASGYLRKCLGRELSLRMVPKLTFYHDTLLLDANRLAQLIDQVIDDEKDNG